MRLSVICKWSSKDYTLVISITSIWNQFIRTAKMSPTGEAAEGGLNDLFWIFTELGCPKIPFNTQDFGRVVPCGNKAEKWAEMMPGVILKHCHFVRKYPRFSYGVYSSSYFLLIYCIWLYYHISLKEKVTRENCFVYFESTWYFSVHLHYSFH